MQVVKRIIGGFFLFILFLWLFSPKQELYYLLEKELKKSDIIISNETIKDTWFGMNLQHADVYVKGVKMAHIDDLELNIFFLYNTLTIKEIHINEAIHNIAPKVINQVGVKYSIMDPLNIQLNGLGSFGTLDGKVALIEKQITVLFPVAKDIKAFRKFLKKDETGEWKYETTY
jgi:hypothetical protein